MSGYRSFLLLGWLAVAMAFQLPAAELPAESSSTNAAKDFNRYQIIIDRSPFGTVSAAGAAVPVPPFATRFQFVGLVSSNGSPAQAILFDKEGNRSHFCVEGEVIKSETDSTGVTVVKIETEPAAKVVLRRGLETATLHFEERPSTGVPQPPRMPSAFMPGGVQGGVPQPPSGTRRIPFRRTN